MPLLIGVPAETVPGERRLSIVPDVVKDWIQDLFSALVGSFVQSASGMVQGIEIPLFELPNTVPGTTTPANLSFTGSGLTAINGFLIAEIAVSSP